MGSISDLPIMEPCIELLKNNNIKVQVDIVSAHRSPKWLYEFGDNIESWCGRVIIAGAGGAAHLPGMLASLTNIPVIGVPVPTSNLGGQDSLYSIVQMPDGVPVATVGIGKSKNAAILAMKILNMKDELNDITWKNEKKVDNQRDELHLLHDNFFR
jgi:5-(carboxyamino)imidazole ribonucleotide mutase